MIDMISLTIKFDVRRKHYEEKILSALLAVSLVAGTIVGCSSDKASDGESNANVEGLTTLKVQTMPNFNGVLLSYIVDQGWARRRRVKLRD